MKDIKKDAWKEGWTTLYVALFFVAVGFSRFNYPFIFAIKPFIVMTAIGVLVTIFVIKRFKKLISFEKWMLLFLVIYMLSCVRPNNLEKGLRYVCGCILIIGFYMCTRIAIEQVKLETLEKIISISGIIICSISLVTYIYGLYLVNFQFREIVRLRSGGVLIEHGAPRLFGIINNDPNIAAMMLMMYAIYYLFHFKGVRNYIGAFLSCACVLLTFSRSALLSLGAAWVISCVIPYFERKPIRLKKWMIFVPIVMILGFSFLSISGFNWLEIIVERLLRLTYDNGTGRFVLWKYGLDGWAHSPIIGIGGNATTGFIELYTEKEQVLHNSWLEVLLETGLVGAIPCLIFLYKVYEVCMNYRIKTGSRQLVMMFFSVVIMMCSISVQFNEGFYLMVAVIYAYSNNDKEKQTDGKCNIY